jgi:hypothetical protein
MKQMIFVAIFASLTASAQYSVIQICGYTQPIVSLDNCEVNTLPTEITIPCLGLVICDLVSDSQVIDGALYTTWNGDGVTATQTRSEGGFKMLIDDNGCRIVIQ